MLTQVMFEVFGKYKSAPPHAFSTGFVSEKDKDYYHRIYETLRAAAKHAIRNPPFSEWFEVWGSRFSKQGGVQGQRPVDLWFSVINVESNSDSRYPQIYMIASEAGIEMGFAVAIHEDDYYNKEIKAKNRAILPHLYQKLPDPDSEIVRRLDAQLDHMSA